MEVMTKAKGRIDIPEEKILTIPEGLFGFEQYTKFALCDSDYEPFLWLQSLEDMNLAFLIVDPFLISNDYETDIDDETLAKILFIDSIACHNSTSSVILFRSSIIAEKFTLLFPWPLLI